MEDAILKALGLAGVVAIFARAIRSIYLKARELNPPSEVIYDLTDWHIE
ncbi:hypothetical protein HY442_00890 [Candidatus Parcubacteria bacterium]|nr:hypothetical protein [Candidatus Parcubacteria bacterium]MBI4385568.1 hypothetical protein [Candidatus Parcubacteria bacterium]